MPVGISLAIDNGLNLTCAIIRVPAIGSNSPVRTVVNYRCFGGCGFGAVSQGLALSSLRLFGLFGHQIVKHNGHTNLFAERDGTIAVKIATLCASYKITQHVCTSLGNVERVHIIALLSARKTTMVVLGQHIAIAINHVYAHNVEAVVAACVLECQSLCASFAE